MDSKILGGGKTVAARIQSRQDLGSFVPLIYWCCQVLGTYFFYQTLAARQPSNKTIGKIANSRVGPRTFSDKVTIKRVFVEPHHMPLPFWVMRPVDLAEAGTTHDVRSSIASGNPYLSQQTIAWPRQSVTTIYNLITR